ncbi:hypothetical protein QFZ27_001979 [Inquilinus ginsengisoli]|uniref:hypothetical protein n=1 Tax=Inquilinus ginsengisoli TaxID=363840 RepID=UPI003D1B2106
MPSTDLTRRSTIPIADDEPASAVPRQRLLKHEGFSRLLPLELARHALARPETERPLFE